MIEQYILPDIMVLIPVLIIIGMMLKKVSYIQDWTIPILLAVVGILLAIITIGAKDGYTYESIVTGIIQGILATGMAVYVHQLSIQTGRKRDQD
jgi:ABC-type uncharacterized transport system permease subunit